MHVHGSESFLGLALAGVQVPAVVSLQGIARAIRSHLFAGLTASELPWVVADWAFLHGYGLLHDAARYEKRAKIERRVLASCNHFMGRTEWDRSVLLALRPDAHYHHAGEVLNEVFYDHPWGRATAAGSVVFTTSGSSPVKGLETLIEAVSVLRRRRGVVPRLRIAGAVESGSLWPMLRRRLRAAGLGHTVEMLGALPPDAVLRELRNAAVFVHPSHIDNSPNSLCEAMLVGVPCAASFVGGIPSLVEDGATGLLFHDRDPFMLAAVIDRLLSDHDLAERLGRAARTEALMRHDPERVAHEVAEVYAEVTSTWPIPRQGPTKAGSGLTQPSGLSRSSQESSRLP
ncbi:MAG TPA: glycosyltransferase family 4 protein [Thermoleophilia bacterium]|nr:glycosyltransferase family 4 protein [Thermoleophilia bacterium]